MLIEFYKKNVYGRELLYIVDEEIANAVCSLTHRKTLEEDDQEALKRLGFGFKEVLSPK